MSHPLMYVLGDTENQDFPLVLIIGREPNYGDVLTNEIGKINVDEFSSMSGGVWVTAYTQFAKQYIGESGTAGHLKKQCFKKNTSPIVFTNAFPIGIPQDVKDKASIRDRIINLIPAHIDAIFSKSLISRVKLVVHHGSDKSEASLLAKKLIEDKCSYFDVPYCSTAFFYNGNSIDIQSSLKRFRVEIKHIFNEFEKSS